MIGGARGCGVDRPPHAGASPGRDPDRDPGDQRARVPDRRRGRPGERVQPPAGPAADPLRARYRRRAVVGIRVRHRDGLRPRPRRHDRHPDGSLRQGPAPRRARAAPGYRARAPGRCAVDRRRVSARNDDVRHVHRIRGRNGGRRQDRAHRGRHRRVVPRCALLRAAPLCRAAVGLRTGAGRRGDA